VQPTSLLFDRGSILVRGEVRVPYTTWDDRAKAYRAQSLHYREIVEYLKRSNLFFKDDVQELLPCPIFSSDIHLRSYQHKALKAWNEAGRKGVIVLPTGAGKTVIAIKAIELISQPTIVVVPTLDLVEQWRSRLEEEFGVKIGIYGGGDTLLQALTVSTYDSAYLRAGEIGNRFCFIIFDEVHHLPAEGYRQIAEMFTAPCRLGLTATFEREDMLHREIPRLTGGVVYWLKPEDLAGRYLAEYTLQKIDVDLTDQERLEYDRHYKVFADFLASRHIKLTTAADFQKFIMRGGRDRDARRALLSRNIALDIAFNSEAKIEALEEIMKNNPSERLLIFTQHNQLVHRISKRFLLPFITHTTDKDERRDILKRFRDGTLRGIVTSKVLDEGIDIPEASIGIILSGTGSSREFIQRLGRLLRKSDGKKARLIELVSRATTETRTSWRRKKNTR
jgi:superfamily II DNA or RNA helicase